MFSKYRRYAVTSVICVGGMLLAGSSSALTRTVNEVDVTQDNNFWNTKGRSNTIVNYGVSAKVDVSGAGVAGFLSSVFGTAESPLDGRAWVMATGSLNGFLALQPGFLLFIR